MSIIPEKLKAKVGSHFLKGDDFADGMDLEVVAFKVISAKDPKYGATEIDWLFKSEKLALGQTFQYTFKTIIDNEDFDVPEEKVFESKSAPFFIAFSNIDPDAGTRINVKRTGEGTKTSYTIKELK